VAVRTQTLGLPRVGWVLTIAAFLCGGMISAAVFSIGWKHEAQRGNSAQSALAAATARTHALTGQLVAQRTRSAALAATRNELTSTNASLRHDLSAARRSLARDKQLLTGIGAAAAPLSGDVDRITNELQSLTSYLTSTPPGALDAGYVQAQVSYLTKTVAGFKAAVAAVQSRAH
jgi:hypothetical protein